MPYRIRLKDHDNKPRLLVCDTAVLDAGQVQCNWTQPDGAICSRTFYTSSPVEVVKLYSGLRDIVRN